jgi:hypothetical protein
MLFHLGFWKIFNWKNELPKLTDLNRGIMQALNIVIVYIFAGATVFIFLLVGHNAINELERALLAFIGGIYILRAAVQFPFFGLKQLGLGLAIIITCILIAGLHIFAALGL